MIKRETMARRINASGLWASYGDAAPWLGHGPRGWRACAKQNWALNARLARLDGTTDHEDQTKGEVWIAAHPAEVLLDTILGYHVSSGGSHLHKGGVMPKELRLGKADLSALAGRSRPHWTLTHRIGDQALKLEEWLQYAPLDHEHRAYVESAMEQAKDLLEFLRATDSVPALAR